VAFAPPTQQAEFAVPIQEPSRAVVRGSVTATTGKPDIRKVIAAKRNASEVLSSEVMGYSAVTGGTGSSYGIPSVLAQTSPLALLHYTQSRVDKLALYRYFSKTDAFVGRALDIHTELPISKIRLSMPKAEGEEQHEKHQMILREYERMCEKIALVSKLVQAVRQYWMVGDVFLWCEWDDKSKTWSRLVCLPPEYMKVVLDPWTDGEKIVYAPNLFASSIYRVTDDLAMVEYGAYTEEDIRNVPEEFREEDTPRELNTDPFKGSFCLHISRNKADFEEYGESLIERILEPLIRQENLRNAQLQIASRNMFPRHIVTAPEINLAQLSDLRTQVDLSMLEPDYPIVANYSISWDEMGADNRLLNLDGEMRNIEDSKITGMGLTREMVTGEGFFSGQRFNLEIMNTQYMSLREALQATIEATLFAPVAKARGYTAREEYEVDNQKKVRVIYLYPTLSFSRLAVKDNADVFDRLYMLYQKGSLSLDVILDLFNIDADDVMRKVEEDIFTPRDPTFNRFTERVLDDLSDSFIEKTNVLDRVIESLKGKVVKVDKSPEEGDEGGGGRSRFFSQSEEDVGVESLVPEELSWSGEYRSRGALSVSIRRGIPGYSRDGRVADEESPEQDSTSTEVSVPSKKAVKQAGAKVLSGKLVPVN